jgi:hypothetical protein
MVAAAIGLVGAGGDAAGGGARWAEPRDSKAEKAKTKTKALSHGP